jgi:hypothetical protein
MTHGYAAERIGGKWIWSIATQDGDEIYCHSGESSWKMRSSGRFFDTLDEAEQFCARMNG